MAQEKKNRGFRSPSVVPLRGYCLIGYYTMMRPDCNLHLRWDEVTLDAKNLTGWYKLDQHKNVNKGIKAEGPLAEEVVEYLLSIRPANPGNAPIHFNPETGLPYVDIRKQWERLMVIASRMLRYDLEDKKRTFFNFRHTGASHIAQRGKTPAHLLAVVQMMGDTSVATVNRHYFKMEPELMRELVFGVEAPGHRRALCRRGRSFRCRAFAHLRDRAPSRQLTRVEEMPCRNVERDFLTATRWGA